jgi:hypothetical protein
MRLSCAKATRDFCPPESVAMICRPVGPLMPNAPLEEAGQQMNAAERRTDDAQMRAVLLDALARELGGKEGDRADREVELAEQSASVSCDA